MVGCNHALIRKGGALISIRYMAYSWIEKNIKPDEAIGYLKNGLDANPAR